MQLASGAANVGLIMSNPFVIVLVSETTVPKTIERVAIRREPLECLMRVERAILHALPS
jgi:hypothetical protein